MATRLDPSTFGYQNFYSALLTADITSGTTTISVDTVPTPTAGILVIDPDSTTSREVILYTSKGASTITCPADGRGYSGTTPASHSTGTTIIMAPIDKWFTALASGELSSDPLRTELFFDYVDSGCVWSGDSYGSTRLASMTSGVVYINGRRLTLAAVVSRTFTASKDTYIDISDNGDGTGLINYTEVANNAASPALASNRIRLGIIVTGAGNIAAAGSVNQGQEDKVLPIASSVAYSVTDSLGNLICPTDPERSLIGYKQIVANAATTTTGSAVTITGLSAPIIVPAGNRKVKITVYIKGLLKSGGAGDVLLLKILEGSNLKAETGYNIPGSNYGMLGLAECVITLAAGSYTINAAYQQATAGTITAEGGVGKASFVKVELI